MGIVGKCIEGSESTLLKATFLEKTPGRMNTFGNICTGVSILEEPQSWVH